MITKQKIFSKIKSLVRLTEPKSKIILYGSYARGDQRKDSDIDLLILIDKEKLTLTDEIKIKYPLYDLEFDTGQLISPLVFSKKDWEQKHRATPFFRNIKREGIAL